MLSSGAPPSAATNSDSAGAKSAVSRTPPAAKEKRYGHLPKNHPLNRQTIAQVSSPTDKLVTPVSKKLYGKKKQQPMQKSLTSLFQSMQLPPQQASAMDVDAAADAHAAAASAAAKAQVSGSHFLVHAPLAAEDEEDDEGDYQPGDEDEEEEEDDEEFEEDDGEDEEDEVAPVKQVKQVKQAKMKQVEQQPKPTASATASGAAHFLVHAPLVDEEVDEEYKPGQSDNEDDDDDDDDDDEEGDDAYVMSAQELRQLRADNRQPATMEMDDV